CCRQTSKFMRVDLPAPFSPRSAWIWPGSTTRSMASLATSEPKRFVIPRSSSFMVGPILPDGIGHEASVRRDETVPAHAEQDALGRHRGVDVPVDDLLTQVL